jgi:hypothetical protein
MVQTPKLQQLRVQMAVTRVLSRMAVAAGGKY